MRLYSYSETILQGYLETNPSFSSLIISENTPKQLIIARLLIGSLKINNHYRDFEFYQLKDTLEHFYTSSSFFPLERMKNYISEELTVEDLANFYNNPSSRRNSKFYSRLLDEFSNYFYYSQKNNFTTAFIYIYRILEVISFAFPLIYAAQTDDFKDTFGYLKQYFKGNQGSNQGELGFFKSFVVKTFESNPIASTSVDFDFSTIHIQNSKMILFRKIKEICGDRILHPATQDFDKLSVNFTDMGSFIITIRNRFFHLFNRGDNNIESEEIFDADALCEILTERCIGWISLIYFEILKNSLLTIRNQ